MNEKISFTMDQKILDTAQKEATPILVFFGGAGLD